MESTTFSSPISTTTEALADTTYFPTGEPLLEAAAAPAHHQITFQIPSHQDMEHIYHMNKLQALLQRIGDVPYDAASAAAAYAPLLPPQHVYNVNHEAAAGAFLPVDAAGNHITNEQIAKSVVLDLADLKGHNGGGWLEALFEGVDMHTVINYVWIAVVTSLIVLSLIFILFSFYFYRKFRVWKKCNKDIRAQLNAEPCSAGTGAAGHLQCSALHHHRHHPHHQLQTAAGAAAQYYQVESPPCYTIATGLPTYDEALHHHNQPQHFAYGMKFVYPNIVAVHHPFVEAQKEELAGKRKEAQEKLFNGATAATDVSTDTVTNSAGNNNNSTSSNQNSLAAASVPLLSGKCPDTRLSIEDDDEEDYDDQATTASDKCTQVFVV